MQSYTNITTLHPLALVATIILGVVLLLVQRKNALLPVLLMICFIAPAQRIVIAGADFTLLRLLTVIGLARVAFRGEFTGLRPSLTDLVVLLWTTVATVIYTLQQQSGAALVFKLGTAIDSLGAYVLVRCLVRTWDDLAAATRMIAWISIPVAACFLLERLTERNLFAVFGGVPAITEIRDGRLRCQGAFAHPILAGCFWASVLPMLWGWTHATRRWWLGSTALLASLFIVAASGSSTPVMAVIFAVLAWCFYPLRRWMGWIMLGAVPLAVALELGTKGPLWSLLAKANVLSSSTGWHRYYLIDRAIAHFDEWWLLGTTTTEHWGWGLWDVTNQYILEGVRGGAVSMVLFMALVLFAFLNSGRARNRAHPDHARSLIAWGLGSAVFVHAMNFIAVSYFGQITFLWFLVLGAGASLAALPRPRTDPKRTASPVRARPALPAPRQAGVEGA